jgi:hypothetical protein
MVRVGLVALACAQVWAGAELRVAQADQSSA